MAFDDISRCINIVNTNLLINFECFHERWFVSTQTAFAVSILYASSSIFTPSALRQKSKTFSFFFFFGNFRSYQAAMLFSSAASRTVNGGKCHLTLVSLCTSLLDAVPFSFVRSSPSPYLPLLCVCVRKCLTLLI